MFRGSKIPPCINSSGAKYRRRWLVLALLLCVILGSKPNSTEAKQPGLPHHHPPLPKNVTVVFGNDTRLFIPPPPPPPCEEGKGPRHLKCPPPHPPGPEHPLNTNVTVPPPPETPKTSSIETSSSATSTASISATDTSTSDTTTGNSNPTTIPKTAIISAAGVGGIAALLGLVGYSIRGRRQAV